MILVVGNINFDILFRLDRLPGPHEKLTCDEAAVGFGGSAANTAYWLAKLKARVTLAGAVGDDPIGETHLAGLQSAGVDTKGVRRLHDTSGIAVIFSLGREKRMVRTPGANMLGVVRPELVKGCKLVYLSGADTQTLGGYAALAKEGDIPLICGWHGAQDAGIAGLADGFILNADEVRLATGIQELNEGIRALDSNIAAVTLPAGGCLVSKGIDVRRVPAPELTPVDRTGGGDAFAAGFIAGIAQGLDVEDCGRWGNKLAAEVIMGVGARPEIANENLELRIKDM
jgi:sugar/nucleoside kinase (ribokinase family)